LLESNKAVSLLWQSSEPVFARSRAKALVNPSQFAKWRGRGRRAGDLLAGSWPCAPALEEPDRSRLITVERGAEAERLSVAFMRFAELHGRVVQDPKSRCGISTAVRRSQDRAQTLVVTLWSRRAAEKFDRFWPRYRAAYGS
jgi:hypothetical protein